MRVKRAIVADNLVTGVLLVFKIIEDDDISWSRMLDELILSYLRKNLSVLERGLVGCGRINPCMFNQPFTRRLECVITVDKA